MRAQVFRAITATLAIAVAGLAGAAWAQEAPPAESDVEAAAGEAEAPEAPRQRVAVRGPQPGQPELRLMLRNAGKLGLSEEQIAKIRELRDAQKAGAADRSEALRVAQEAVIEELAKDLPDLDVLLAKTDEINRMNGEVQRERLRTSVAARSVLTPEQRAQFVEIREAAPARQRPRRIRLGPNRPKRGAKIRAGGAAPAPTEPAPDQP